MKIRCQDCGRIVEVEKDWNTEATCDECSGSFAELNSEDDTYELDDEEEEEETEEEESEKSTDCIICGKEQKEGDYIEWDSDDCDDYSDYDKLLICKKCIDKSYPRQTEIKEVVKFVENPIETSYTKFNPEAKSKFD